MGVESLLGSAHRVSAIEARVNVVYFPPRYLEPRKGKSNTREHRTRSQ